MEVASNGLNFEEFQTLAAEAVDNDQGVLSQESSPLSMVGRLARDRHGWMVSEVHGGEVGLCVDEVPDGGCSLVTVGVESGRSRDASSSTGSR